MGKSEAPRGRVAYALASQVARSVVRRAHGIQIANSEKSRAKSRGLRPIELKVLTSVIALTAMYSKVSDYVYLAEIAAITYGVEESEPWQSEKARKALKTLAAHGLIEYRPPKGRPDQATGRPAYFVALVGEETQPQAGLDYPEEKAAPRRVETQPRVGKKSAPPRVVESQPRVGGPTEEKNTEKIITEKKNREAIAMGQTQPSREGLRDSALAGLAREDVGEDPGRPVDGRAYAREKAERPKPPWEMPLKNPNDPQACSRAECLERRASGADLCASHYWERQAAMCGVSRCTEEGRDVRTPDRTVKRCEAHRRDLLDGEHGEPDDDFGNNSLDGPKTPRVNARGSGSSSGLCFNCQEPTGAVYPCPVCEYDPNDPKHDEPSDLTPMSFEDFLAHVELEDAEH